jgi:hypothetical protein
MAGHSSVVVCDDKPSFFCSPDKQFGIGRFAEACFKSGDGIQVGNALLESAQNVMVEIVVYEEPEHY